MRWRGSSTGFPDIVALDGEVSNSTFSEIFKNDTSGTVFLRCILRSRTWRVRSRPGGPREDPFVSTFAAFLTRAFDQIRMSEYSRSNIKFVGSHAGVSIGQDGPSQMGLEDIAMFRTLLDGVVLYPCDAVSTERLVEKAAEHKGIVYIRTTRMDTPILYDSNEEFVIGGSKVLRRSDKDQVTVIAAGVTVFEALAAFEALKEEDIFAPGDRPLQHQAPGPSHPSRGRAGHKGDHHRGGPLCRGGPWRGCTERSGARTYAGPHTWLCGKCLRSGTPGELLDYEGISRRPLSRK